MNTGTPSELTQITIVLDAEANASLAQLVKQSGMPATQILNEALAEAFRAVKERLANTYP